MKIAGKFPHLNVETSKISQKSLDWLKNSENKVRAVRLRAVIFIIDLPSQDNDL